MNVISAFFLVMIIASVVAISFLASRRATRVDSAWLAGPQFGDPTDPGHIEAVEVCRRYLSRHARHRFAGGLFGMVFALVVGVRWYSSISVGIGSGSPFADLFFCGLTGVIVGALSAESFRLGSDDAEQRAASLAPRDVAAGAQRVVLARRVAGGAIAVGLTAGLTGYGWLALITSFILVGPLVVAELVRIVVVGRSRPVMSDGAQIVDRRIRSFALASVSFLQLATAALMLGWSMAKVDGLTGVVAFAQFLGVLGCLVVAIVMLRRAAPRPPKGAADFVAEPSEVFAGTSS